MVTTVRVEQARTDRADGDHTVGCGQTPGDHQPDQPFKSGRICAGTGAQPSCQLCPHSPNYWRKT